MSNKILDIIASETNGKSYKTYKYCFDSAETSPIDYDDNKQITWKNMVRRFHLKVLKT